MVVGICLYALWTIVLRTGQVYSLSLFAQVYSLRNFQLTLKASKAQFRFSSAPYRKRLAVVTKNKHKNCKIIIFSAISGIIKQAFLQKWFTFGPPWLLLSSLFISNFDCVNQIHWFWIHSSYIRPCWSIFKCLMAWKVLPYANWNLQQIWTSE